MAGESFVEHLVSKIFPNLNVIGHLPVPAGSYFDVCIGFIKTPEIRTPHNVHKSSKARKLRTNIFKTSNNTRI